MLPLSILEKTCDSVLYEISPGKPNPQEMYPKGVDKRERVFQSGLKGVACWYYAFNFLRRRIGKNPCESLLAERAIEKLCSQRRKEQTAYDDAFPVAIHELYSKSDISIIRKLDLKHAQLFLESPLASLDPLDGRSSLLPYIQEFIKEKTHKNILEFLVFKRASRLIQINMNFLNNFNTDVHKMIGHKKWKKLDAEQQSAALETYVRDFSADLYNVKKSEWKPSLGIDELLDELKRKGPLMVLGNLGTPAYIDTPFQMARKISNRDIYAWRPGAMRSDLIAGHAILLVGARKVQNKAFVYFIDPADPSDPFDPSKQKIYMISFANLTSNIRSLTGHKELESDAGHAYYGNFEI